MAGDSLSGKIEKGVSLMEIHEVPENQIDIFEMLDDIKSETDKSFNSAKATWSKNIVSELQCEVLAIIPSSITTPSERRFTDKDYDNKQDTWGAYVWGIVHTIPYEERDKKNDINGWLMASARFKEARDNKNPIVLVVSEVWQSVFNELEVLEYL